MGVIDGASLTTTIYSPVSTTKEFGSHASPLVRVFLDDELHQKGVQLSPTDWLSLVTWIDANAPCHDAFLNKRPGDGGGAIRDVSLKWAPLVNAHLRRTRGDESHAAQVPTLPTRLAPHDFAAQTDILAELPTDSERQIVES